MTVTHPSFHDLRVFPFFGYSINMRTAAILAILTCASAIPFFVLNPGFPVSGQGKFMLPESILVLGSGGLVGRSLVRQLRASNYTVVEVKNRHHVDLRDTGALERAFEGRRFAFCFFLAFEVGGAKFLSAAEHEQTVISSTQRMYGEVFGFLRRTGIPFLFISTQQIHSNSTYGRLKAQGERIVHDLPTGRSVRLSNVYGMDYSGLKSHIITDALTACLMHGGFRVGSDGLEKRQFIHADDLAQALVAAMQGMPQLPPVFSITTTTWTTIQDVMGAVRAAVPNCQITYGPTPAQFAMVGESNASMVFAPKNVTYRPLMEGVRAVASQLSSNMQNWTDNSRSPLVSVVVHGNGNASWDEFVNWMQQWNKATAGLFLEEEILATIRPGSAAMFNKACASVASNTKRVTAMSPATSVPFSELLSGAAGRAQSDFLVLWPVNLTPTRALAEFLWHKALRADAVYYAIKNGSSVPAARVAPHDSSNVFQDGACEGFIMLSKSAFVQAGGLRGNTPFSTLIANLQRTAGLDRVILDMPFLQCSQYNAFPPQHDSQTSLQRLTQLNVQSCSVPVTRRRLQPMAPTFITVVVTSSTFDAFWALAGSIARTPQQSFKLLVFHCGLTLPQVVSLSHVEDAVVVQSDAQNGTAEVWNKHAFHPCSQGSLAAFALNASVAMHGYVLFVAASHILDYSRNVPGTPAPAVQELQAIAAKLQNVGVIKFGTATMGMPAVMGGYTERDATSYYAVPQEEVPACLVPVSDKSIKEASCFTAMRQIPTALNVTLSEVRTPVPQPAMVCAAVGTHSVPGLVLSDSPLVSTLLPSYVKAAALSDMHHRIYIGYDVGDALLDDMQRVPEVINTLNSFFPSDARNISYRLMRGPRVYGNVDYVWNFLFHQAFLDGCDFFLQLVDDVQFPATRWAEAFAAALAKHDPPLFGVVGSPAAPGSNSLISQPFVHRTHFAVWGSFYPPVFHNWYGDTWLTFVYSNSGFATRLTEHSLSNTQVKGTKYTPCTAHEHEYTLLLQKQKAFVESVASKLRAASGG